jgi:hypothetical protein
MYSVLSLLRSVTWGYFEKTLWVGYPSIEIAVVAANAENESPSLNVDENNPLGPAGTTADDVPWVPPDTPTSTDKPITGTGFIGTLRPSDKTVMTSDIFVGDSSAHGSRYI